MLFCVKARGVTSVKMNCGQTCKKIDRHAKTEGQTNKDIVRQTYVDTHGIGKER